MAADGGNGSGWTVTSQQEVTDRDAGGRFVPGVRVSFTTAGGLSGSVFIPDTLYNADTARQMISARVAQLSGISGLSG